VTAALHSGSRLAPAGVDVSMIAPKSPGHRVRELYLEGTGARLCHYRDETGLTIDAIIEYPDRSWAALQTRLGEHQLLEAEMQLHTLLDDRLDLDRVGRPRFLAILTATTQGHTTRSGTRIVPLPSLTA